MIIVDDNLKPENFVMRNDYNQFGEILKHIYFGNNFMLASEGHILLYAKVKMDKGDEYTLISKEQYIQARKLSKGHYGVHFVIGDENIAFADETTSPKIKYDRKKLIEFGQVCAKLINFSKSRLGGIKDSMLINKQYFKTCFEAFGKDTSVKLIFGKTERDVVFIKPVDYVPDNNAFAMFLGMSDKSLTPESEKEFQDARREFYAKYKKQEPETKKGKKKK